MARIAIIFLDVCLQLARVLARHRHEKFPEYLDIVVEEHHTDEVVLPESIDHLVRFLKIVQQQEAFPASAFSVSSALSTSASER